MRSRHPSRLETARRSAAQLVRILACARAPETFDARFSCLYRAYQPLGPVLHSEL